MKKGALARAQNTSYNPRMRHLISQIIFFTAFQLIAGEPELKGTPTELARHLKELNRIVTVSGEGELKVPADRAIVTLRLTSESKSLQEALRANQVLRTKLVSTLTAQGIPADRIDAGGFSSTPRHWVLTDKVRSYKVEALVKVTAADDNQFQQTARVMDELSGIDYHSIDFEHSTKEELKRKALAEALQNAIARKKVYEQQLNVTLLPLRFAETAIQTGVQSGAPPVQAKTSIPSLSFREGPGPFNELVFTARVTVDYILEAK
jgi:uncharacterized protein YggE